MDFGIAAAGLIIAFFTLFIVWGRSANGQQVLVRLFGPARTPSRPAKRSRRQTSGTRKSTASRKTAPRDSGSKTANSTRARRASKR